MRVLLRGYPAAVSGLDEVEVSDYESMTPAQLAAAVADQLDDDRIRRVLFTTGGALRASTRVLDGAGALVDPLAMVRENATLLAVLPCDG